MDPFRFLEANRHHLTITLDPEQLEKIIMALLDATNALVAQMGKDAATLAANPPGNTVAAENVAAIAEAYAPVSALINPAAPTDTFTFSPTSLPTPVAGTPYSQAVSATSTDGAATVTVPASKQDGTPNALPSGATFDGATLSWADPVSGTYGFEMLATDSSGATATLVTSWSF